MMKTYYVYNHPLYGQRIEETGTNFTFLGFFFTVIWLAIKKLYLIATLTFALFLMSSVADKIVSDLMRSKINTVLSTPLSELYENGRYREIYLSTVDPEVAPWKINKARSKPKYINPWADTAIPQEKNAATTGDKFYDPDEAFSSSDPATKGLVDATLRHAPELSEDQKFILSRR